MLKQVAEGVLVHQSEVLRNNTIVVQGTDGVLLIDPGITHAELSSLVADLRELGQAVAAGFATHPHWDHVLWHPDLGDAPRYGTERCATDMRDLLANENWEDRVATVVPEDLAGEVPLELFGLITALPAGTTHIPWDGPRVRIIENPAHVQGHAALFIESHGVLVAGDMLSDILMPFPNLGAADPIGDYLAGLQLLEDIADDVDVVIPGHGSVGAAGQVRARIELDRAYLLAVRDGRTPDDPRIVPSASYGGDWLPGVYEWQAKQLGPQ